MSVPNNSGVPMLPVAERKRKREPRKANYMKKILDNDVATKLSSFNKRKPTLMKKASELQTLCDVPVCMVCYDSNGNVDTWPENRHEVVSLINRYKKAKDHEKRGGDAIGLLESSRKKLAAKVRENVERNCEEVANGLSRLFDGLSTDALAESLCVLDSKLKLIKERMDGMLLKKGGTCERKQLFDQGGGGFGDVHENSDVGLQVVDDAQTSLDVSYFIRTIINHPYIPWSSVLKMAKYKDIPMDSFLGNVDDVAPNNLTAGGNLDHFYQGGGESGDLHENSDNGLQIVYDQTILDVSDYDIGTMISHPCETSNSILELENCNNLMDGAMGNVDDVAEDCFHSDVGTSYGVMPNENCLVDCDLGWLDDLIVDGNNPFLQSDSMLLGNVDDAVPDCLQSDSSTSYGVMPNDNCDLGWLDDLLIDDGNNPFCQSNSMLLGFPDSNIHDFGVVKSGSASQPPQSHGYPWTLEYAEDGLDSSSYRLFV